MCVCLCVMVLGPSISPLSTPSSFGRSQATEAATVTAAAAMAVAVPAAAVPAAAAAAGIWTTIFRFKRSELQRDWGARV